MSYQKDREKFIADMQQEGMSVDVALAILRDAQSIQTYAELSCNSEAADRDRVLPPKEMDVADGDKDAAGKIPRHAVRSWRCEQRIAKRLASISSPGGLHIFAADFQGDPRGACVKIKVPSGRTDDWGRTGMCVPTRDS